MPVSPGTQDHRSYRHMGSHAGASQEQIPLFAARSISWNPGGTPMFWDWPLWCCEAGDCYGGGIRPHPRSQRHDVGSTYVDHVIMETINCTFLWFTKPLCWPGSAISGPGLLEGWRWLGGAEQQATSHVPRSGGNHSIGDPIGPAVLRSASIGGARRCSGRGLRCRRNRQDPGPRRNL